MFPPCLQIMAQSWRNVADYFYMNIFRKSEEYLNSVEIKEIAREKSPGLIRRTSMDLHQNLCAAGH